MSDEESMSLSEEPFNVDRKRARCVVECMQSALWRRKAREKSGDGDILSRVFDIVRE